MALPSNKGRVVFKNGIDATRFLLDNRRSVGAAIGVESSEIYMGRRNSGKMEQFIQTLKGKYDIGDFSRTMQMYISMKDGNIGSLDSGKDWVDYVTTQDWVDDLSRYVAGEEEGE